MSSVRQIPTWLLVFLALAAGSGLGVLGARVWAAHASRIERSARAAWAESGQRLDSTRLAEFARIESLHRAQDTLGPRAMPMEVERQQIGGGCMVTVLMMDQHGAVAQLFDAEATDFDGTRLGRAYDYSDHGFPRGSLAHVIFPGLECGRMRITLFGFATHFRRSERGLDVR